jgi:hypothetical protein
MDKDEALKLALDALINHEGNYELEKAGAARSHKAITAIKQALAQPAPVQERTCKQSLQVWVISNGKGAGQFSWDSQDERFWTRMEPTAQPAVPLTDEQISAIGSKIFPSTWNTRHVEFARAIEAKLKEKTT